jgi:hypothetical protein
MNEIAEQVEAEKRRNEFYITVAESLQLTLNLPEGRGLVGLVGNGEERSNRRALANWVAAHWDADESENAREACEVLANELASELYEYMN